MRNFLQKIHDSTLALGIFFTLSMVANALLLRHLGLESFPSSASLSLRGIMCLVLALIYARSQKLSLKPKKPNFQLMRAVLAATSLFSIIASYHFVHASTVTLLQRLDLLVLCLLGLHASTRKDTQLHVWAIVISFALMSYLLKDNVERIEGYLLASLGAIGIAIGYIFMKKSQASENLAITIAVPSLSSAILGVSLGPKVFTDALSNPLSLLALSSGVFMFASYYLTLKLYQRMNMATAEFPTLLATTLVMPLEMLLFARNMNPLLFIFDSFIVLWLSWLLGVPQHFMKSKKPSVAINC